ncbi:MAG: preprotein translocase subunit SecE [Christensenellales bacterium]
MDKAKTQTTNAKKASGSPNVFERIGRYFKEVFGETKKLSWPTRKELVSYTLTVIAFVAIFAVIIGLLDMLFSLGYTRLAGTSALISTFLM